LLALEYESTNIPFREMVVLAVASVSLNRALGAKREPDLTKALTEPTIFLPCLRSCL